MRTTINLDPDLTAAAEKLRGEDGLGIGEAVNTLARRGLGMPDKTVRPPFVQRTHPLGLLINIDNTAELLDQWDADDRKGH
jgi:hypothetical protein